MKGIIIVNSHTHNSLLDYQPKRLKQEFELLGHNIDIVDNDCFVVTIENQGFKSKLHEYDFCIYLDKDIPTLKAIEKTGIRIFNNPSAIINCDDKALTYIELCGLVPLPKTLFGAKIYNQEEIKNSYIENIEKELRYPFILKINKSSQGRGVFLINNREELLCQLNLNKDKDLIFQEYISQAKGEDIRILTIGHNVIGAIKRYSTNGDFRSNCAVGGSAEVYPLDDQLKSIALSIVDKMNLTYSGIDILKTNSSQYMVCEVNSNAFFKTFEETTKENIAKQYAMYILNEINRS